MKTKQEKLSAEQLARMPEWVEKWVAVGLSTDPADFVAAEAGVRGCYRAAGLREPAIVFHVGSPLSSVLAGCHAVALLRSQVWSQVESQVESQVASQFWSQVASHRGGNVWAAWYAYISFIRDVFGWKDPTLKGFGYDEQHALNASWCWYHDDVASISDRPERLRRNELGSLHCDTGPALAYRDGWTLWYINGVAVDEQIVLRPEMQSISEIDGEKNAEVRRIRLERYGWPRYLRETNAKVLDYRRNDVDATDESLMQSADGSRILVCACPSTAKVFTMRVPREIEKCEQAQAWLHGDRKLRIVGAS